MIRKNNPVGFVPGAPKVSGLTISFDSMREFGTFIRDTPRKWAQDMSESAEKSLDWDLNTDFEGAVQYARNGWLEGAKRAQGKLKKLQNAGVAARKRNSFAGGSVNVPRFIAGAPDCMVEKRKTPGAKTLRLFVSICANGHISAEYMANYGVAVAHYVKQLEATGIKCEVYAVASTRMTAGRVTMQVCVKKFSQRFDLAVLCFAIGHPAMLRRLEFAFDERCGVRETGGYGSAVHALETELVGYNKGDVLLNSMSEAHMCAKTPLKAFEFLNDEINNQRKKG